MRQENFLIALFNKELLDLRVPLPRGWPTEEGKGRTLTRALEWNLQFCLMEYLFDRRGQVRKVFLKSKNRTTLIDGCVIRNDMPQPWLTWVCRLRRRFIFMGILNAIFAPFIVVYLLMYSFFRYFEVLLSSPVMGLSLMAKNRNHIRIPLQSVVAHILLLHSGSFGNSTNSRTFLNDVSRNHTLLQICT